MTVQQLTDLLEWDLCGNVPLVRMDRFRCQLAAEGVIGRQAQDNAINDARRAGLVTLTGLESTRNVDRLESLLEASIREYDQCLSYISLKVKE